MSSPAPAFRLSAATAIHRGDRAYQQDQVALLPHPRVAGCALALVADGMGGKSGGRKASDQVMLTGKQLFERFSPGQDDASDMLRQVALEAHLMIKLTAIAAEEEPHSTIAGFVLLPGLKACIVNSGDSRVHHFRGPDMLLRTACHARCRIGRQSHRGRDVCQDTVVENKEVRDQRFHAELNQCGRSHRHHDDVVGCGGNAATHENAHQTSHDQRSQKSQ